MAGFFSDIFRVDTQVLDDYGSLDISLVADVPLFIDPFLLFHSDKAEYKQLHDDVIEYLKFLKTRSESGDVDDGLLRGWYCFPEVRQNWLGYAELGNGGSGLGIEFAKALNDSLGLLFPEFGQESVTRGSHLEKVCLVRKGVGRDNISDFTTNLIKPFLLKYTEKFAKDYIDKKFLKKFTVDRAFFSYELEVWLPKQYELPAFGGDYVILTPKDILTKDDNWINQTDLVEKFRDIPASIPNSVLRAQVQNYFEKALKQDRRKPPTVSERREAAISTLREFPEIVDYYIRLKELKGDEAAKISDERVLFAQIIFRNSVSGFRAELPDEFYNLNPLGSRDEAMQRLLYLKHVVEDQGGHRLFYIGKQPIRRESDLHVLYRLVWYGTKFDFSAEANDGRGPVDFKVSFGSKDKSLVEFKLAANTNLKNNLAQQVEIYKEASDAQHGIKAIVYFTLPELNRVKRILKELKAEGDPNIVLIDARSDNKPSGSKAK